MVNISQILASSSIIMLIYTFFKKDNIFEKFNTESELSNLVDTLTEQTKNLQNRIINTNENMEILRKTVDKNYTMNPDC